MSATSAAVARLAIIGNPNTGKTTLFNRLTGSSARVGNYPGVTVERLEGVWALPTRGAVTLLDVPGTYSLAARSGEEEIAVQSIAGFGGERRPDLLVLVVDATQLSRNLYLALQVLELGVPTVIALNMVDRLAEKGLTVDVALLAERLGVPVVPTGAASGEGVTELVAAVEALLANPRGRSGPPGAAFTGPLAADVAAVGGFLPDSWDVADPHRRSALAAWALLSLGDGDELDDVPEALRRCVETRLAEAELACRDLDEELVRHRYEAIDHLLTGVLRAEPSATSALTDRIDRLLLHPALGFGLFLGVMTVIFQALFTGAEPLIGGIESLVTALGEQAAALLPAGILSDFLVKGLIAGVGSVLVFLPQILLLFLFLGVLEDSGYMARVAYLMDRVMRSIGLHGRAFVPMLSGFACAVPAILATRTMERRRDRFLTMMVVPLMTCSARLPVYGLLIAAFVAEGSGAFTKGLLLVAMYVFSVVVALLAAAVLGRTVLAGPRVPLILEMPPYRLPHWPSVLRRTWRAGATFLREAGSVILVCTIAMWFLLSFPRAEPAAPTTGGELSAPATDLASTYGGRIGRALEPVLAPLGFDDRIGIGILGSFAAREVFVSTMAVVYGLEDGDDETSLALRDRIRAERRTDGSPVYTPLTCLSLMIFFALACQCLSTLAAVKRETRTWKWPAFLFAYMTILAWMASFAVYQGGRLLGFA